MTLNVSLNSFLPQVVIISKVAVDRLCAKLEQWRDTGQAVDMYEEFRLLTLQVIGKAILSLPPEECDKVGGKGALGSRHRV